jgi:hypothetical protein
MDKNEKVLAEYMKVGRITDAANAGGMTFSEAREILMQERVLPENYHPSVIHKIRIAGQPSAKAVKNNVRLRDGYRCVLCGKEQKTRTLETHHINCDPYDDREDNMVTLCHSCHRLAHGRAKQQIGESFMSYISSSETKK